MDKRVAKCLDSIGEAFKTLITSANSETELIGLMVTVFSNIQGIYEKAVDEGINELEKRKKEI